MGCAPNIAEKPGIVSGNIAEVDYSFLPVSFGYFAPGVWPSQGGAQQRSCAVKHSQDVLPLLPLECFCTLALAGHLPSEAQGSYPVIGVDASLCMSQQISRCPIEAASVTPMNVLLCFSFAANMVLFAYLLDREAAWPRSGECTPH